MVACFFSFYLLSYYIIRQRGELGGVAGRDARLDRARMDEKPRCVMGETSPIHGTLG